MAKTPAATVRKIRLSDARREWFERQHLHAPSDLSTESVVERTGWVRTLGGADVYIACWARQARFDFGGLNAAVRRRDLQVLPSVRNCIYLVPRKDAALALRVAEQQWRPRTTRELEKAGSDWKEVEDAAKAVLEGLRKGGLTPDGLRRSLPAGAIRSLGEKGKKAGMSSVLPVALRFLEFGGQVRRSLPEGRLDSEKYVWEVVEAPDAGRSPEDAGERLAKLAARFFEFAAPASAAHFADWAGISKKAALTAIASAGLVPIEIEGQPGPTFTTPGSGEPSAGPSGSVALLPFEDNLSALHGGSGLLADREHHSIPVPTWGSSRPSTLGEGAHVALRTIVVDGQIVGFWEFDPDSARVLTRLLVTGIVESRLAERIASLEGLLTRDLGHGHSFSLDTDESLRERVKMLRGGGSDA